MAVPSGAVADWKKLLDDAVSSIGEGAKAAGDGLRELADDARKVAGIGRGSVEIVPDRTRHRLGGTIAGTLRLALSEPVAARRLVVALRARRRRNALGSLASRGRDTGPSEELVFEFESVVDGERVYESGEHRFEIDVPTEIEVNVQAGGLLGEALRAVKTVDAMTHGQLRWRLEAWLDIPWKRNLSGAIEIAVREEMEGDDDDPPIGEPPKKEPPKKEPPQQEPPQRDPPKKEPPRREPPKEPPHRDPPKKEPPIGDPPKQDPPTQASAKPEPEPPRSRVERPPRPAVSASAFAELLTHRLDDLRRRGFVVIHEHRPPPVDPRVVMQALGEHPDLDAELLQFYAVMDGLEIVLAQPRVGAPEYATITAARDVAVRFGGTIGCLGEILMHGDIAPALVREFCDDTIRVLEIPTLARLLDDSEDFRHRDGRNAIFGAITFRYGDWFGITRADEIRSWRQPAPGQPSRDGYYDHHANAWQAELREREATQRSAWWVVHGDDHGAGLCDPKLLRWPELLALCLAHLDGR